MQDPQENRQQPEPPDSPTVAWSRRALRGDQDAFQALFDRHYARILRATGARLGWLLANCRDEIEDAVQAAFADTFQRMQANSIPGILSDGAFRSYVATAAANQVRQMRRGRAARKRGGNEVRRRADFDLQDGESVFAMIGAKEPGPTTQARRQELEDRIEQAVLDLPEPYRTAIELHCYCGMSYEEIAAGGELLSSRTGSPIRTREAVKLIVYRARQLLIGVVPE